MRVLWWVCAALLWAGEARGQVREVGHEVVVSARGGVARYEVRRSFYNEGERAGLELMVRAPYEAAATGLRVVEGPGATLGWAGSEVLALRLDPLAPDELATVEYTLVGPLGRSGGRAALRYPAGELMGVSGRAPVVLRIEASSGERAWLNGVRVPLKAPLYAEKIGASGDVLSVQIGEASEALAGRFGVAQGGGAVLVDVGLEAPRRLSALPKGAAVVFVVDGALARGEGVAAQLEVVRAYMGHVPDARVELVVVGAEARRVFGRLVGAGELEEALGQAGVLSGGGGGALVSGVEVAASVLAGEVGERRLVVMSARALEAGARVEAAMGRLGAGVVAHGVRVGGGDGWARLERVWAPELGVWARGGGIVGVLRGGRLGLAEEVLELVRPTRVEGLRWSLGEEALPMWREGASLQLGAWVGEAPSSVEVTGWLWGERVRLVARRARGLDGLAASAALWTPGREAVRRAVAQRAGVVTPWRSLRARRGRGVWEGVEAAWGLGWGRGGGEAWREARGEDAGLREVAHWVEVEVRGERAIYRVQRSFYNAEAVAAEARVEVALPPGVEARGLEEGRWLRVAAPPGGLVTRAYTLEAAVRREGVVWYREGEAGMGPVVVRVASGRGGRVWVDGRVAPAGAAVAVARVRHALCGEGPASCVVSERRGSWPGVARYAYVVADIRHPRPADLVVTLIDPAGEPYVVHDRAAGVDLSRLSARLERRWAHGEGVWALRIEDHGAGEAGALRGWRIGESAEALRVLGGPSVVIPSRSAVDGASVRIEVAR